MERSIYDECLLNYRRVAKHDMKLLHNDFWLRKLYREPSRAVPNELFWTHDSVDELGSDQLRDEQSLPNLHRPAIVSQWHVRLS